MSPFRLFNARQNARKLVRERWSAIREFAGRHPFNGTALSDSAITLLERRFNRRLPLDLRELYLLVDGQSAQLGWGLVGSPGLLNGHRFETLLPT